ncbi:hypothetical protein M0R45_036517 [Rubus argutus]|uniref:Uncharacterized protein n=1 Tax=Rubus argutus TaxID=59490 RepID=A0AAW1VY43_RUBAR
MILRNNLKRLRMGYSKLLSTFSSEGRRFTVGNVKPLHICLQSHLVHRYITTTSSANQQKFTVNYLINSCGLSPEGAVLASKRFKLRSPEKADSVLAVLRKHGFSKTQISKVVRSLPEIIGADPEKTLLPKLEYLNSLGTSREDIVSTLASSPSVLGRSLEKAIIPYYDSLRSVLSDKDVVAVFKRCSWMFPNKNVVPNIMLLRELGTPSSCVSMLIRTWLLKLDHEKFCQVIREVNEMGFDMEKTVSVSAMVALGCKNSKSTMNRSRQIFMSRWGWSEDDVLSAFMKYPKCMIVSEKKLMQVMDFLVNKMGWSSRMIAKHPLVWSFSLDKRITPRCSVVKVLLSKGLIKENFSVSYVLCCTEKHFLDTFVYRYLNQVPELQNVYQGKVDIQDE